MENNGLFYQDLHDLERILAQYDADPAAFLKRFNPYECASSRFTDRKSAEMILNLINR